MDKGFFGIVGEGMKPNAIEALPPPLERLAAGTVARPYPRNAVIVTEGDENDRLFVLLSGCAKVYISGEDGREIELNRIVFARRLPAHW